MSKKCKLKPCPFCGSEVELYKDTDSVWTINCPNCELNLDIMWFTRIHTKKDLINYWNYRPLEKEHK